MGLIKVQAWLTFKNQDKQRTNYMTISLQKMYSTKCKTHPCFKKCQLSANYK